MKCTAILVLAALFALPLAATGEAKGDGKPPLKVLEDLSIPSTPPRPRRPTSKGRSFSI